MSCEDWKEVKLGEICKIRRGASPRPIKNFLSERGMPWIKIADATGTSSRYIRETKQFIKPEGVCKSVKVSPGTLILSNSATPGLPKFVAIEACVHDGWLVLSNSLYVTKEFLYYKLICEREGLVNFSNGSVFNNLKTDIVRNYLIKIPPLDEQKEIAKILSSIDDKIELNHQINQDLEEMAQAIFKSWFVDFEPFRDGEFVDSELGPIPKGWEVVTLADICKTQYGYTASAKEEKVGPKFLRVKDINKSNWIDWSSVPYAEINEKNYIKYKLEFGDILVARMADPGKSAIIDDEYEIDAVFASYLVRLKLLDITYCYYVYYFLKSQLYRNYCKQMASGSVQKNMNAKVITGVKLLLPPKNDIEKFTNQISVIRKNILNNVQQNQILSNLRDTLLPKLMSGEIRV